MKQIPSKAWLSYIGKLRRLNTTVANCMQAYVDQYGVSDSQKLIDVAYGLVTKYGEGSAALACEMYDALAELQGAHVPAAEPAETAEYGEVARMVNATKTSTPQLKSGVSRLVKRAGADTMLKNALRDGAEFAWVPNGDTCAFCMTLASRGWQRASKKAIKNGHAEHIHANCDCTYAIRFDPEVNVEGYDPDAYLKAYRDAGSDVNELRRIHYAENRERINAQKRAAYAERNAKERIEAEKASLLDLTESNKRDKTKVKEKDRLPKYQFATINEEKLTHYALNLQKAPDKAKAFRDALGYTQNNFQELIAQIYENLPNFPAKEKGNRGWGMTYEVIMELKGPNGKVAKVLTAWIDDEKTGEMRLTTLHVDK